MSKKYLNLILGIIILSISIYAIGFHNANEILPGTFNGNYIFNGNLTLTGEINSENWTLANLENSWINYNSAYTYASYKKDTQGFIHIRGLVAGGATACIFTLPIGYRPEKISTFGSVANNAIARISVYPSGCVYPDLASSAWTSLEGITFEAYQ